jgi:putative toxin-antitoxin system antitoxin component (TIGR02293 family)
MSTAPRKVAAYHADATTGRAAKPPTNAPKTAVDVDIIVGRLPRAPHKVQAVTYTAHRVGATGSPFVRSYSLLGKKRFYDAPVTTDIEVHNAIVAGVRFGGLLYLTEHFKQLPEDDVAKVLGVSVRTLQRYSEKPSSHMPHDLASKAWRLAELLAKAMEVFGSRDDAERWMANPAMGLDGQRPIDLMQTIQGAEIVEDFLGRLEHGVYT